MRFIKKHLSLWRIVLISCVAAIAIPISGRVGPRHSKTGKTAVSVGIARLQDDDDYYDRRREYWEKRVERELDDEEGDDDDGETKDSKDKDSKKAADDEDDENDNADQEIERRREYWRKRLDRDW
jgi:hypothetical protein